MSAERNDDARAQLETILGKLSARAEVRVLVRAEAPGGLPFWAAGSRAAIFNPHEQSWELFEDYDFAGDRQDEDAAIHWTLGKD